MIGGQNKYIGYQVLKEGVINIKSVIIQYEQKRMDVEKLNQLYKDKVPGYVKDSIKTKIKTLKVTIKKGKS